MILLTGGAGYIGSHITLALLDRGDDVLVLDNLSTGNRWLVPEGAKFVEGDCGDTALVEALVAEHGITAAIHCAGVISVPESVEKPLLYYDINVGRAVRFFAAATAAGVRHLLFSSTATVYGALDLDMLSESLPMAPVNPYAASKAMTERALADLAATGAANVAVLRYFNVAGADPAGRSGQVSKQATHLIKIAAEVVTGKRDHISVTGNDFATPDGTGVRDYIHITDLAAAHLVALDALVADPAESLTFNVGYGHGASVLEVLDAVDRFTNSRMRRVPAPRRPGDVARLVADTSAIRARLGWEPKLDDLDRIVADAIAWERKLAARA
ncbi:UDP-glucose 4-epimerase GalE [Polymorphobacter fuscus]|uniref:UDP-glucose 4-epimerase n=1 Tax=Sandarakinorhabdus fusca TaxID=1439888 RepID=A0A7C9GPL4_9SPHN|nr:UDP-glucose 4-epimerase GalE [Polymorphobacter fuscus]KAB7646402.1 UDP-glucose 4-epimerase GalE [Polymorphobacter fuscus]MQT17637.1 UDP-glucose 4-epimerase GalE [Polymorphobacter fuscus]NJC09819.1 UDP-glucose 4-epimerase [Polymorphobacter fuscus]